MMRKNHVLWIAGALVFLLLFSVSHQAFAGTTGKIKGTVVDSNGEALPGANVIIEGTTRGAIVGLEGDYVILLVDPGTYGLTASMVGYDKVTKTDVAVAADFTTTVDFALKETALEMEELVVVAERPPVEPDRTTSKYIMDNVEMERISPLVKDTGPILELMAGVGLDGDTSIRGGDTSSSASGTSDVIYYVDGVPMSAINVERRSHASQNFQGVNASAVQEIAVVTGGMEAEYGNAQAGVINIVTREGSRDFHGSLDYLWVPPGQKHWGSDVYESPYYQDKMKWDDSEWVNETDPETGRMVHERIDYTGVQGHRLEGTLSGPLGKKASFFVSAKYRGFAAVFPEAKQRGFYLFPDRKGGWVASPGNIETSYKLGWDVRPDMKVRVGGIYGRSGSYWGGGGVRRELGRDIFLPEGSGSGEVEYKNDMAYLALTHTLNPKTFYELRISWYREKHDTTGVPMDPFGEGITDDIRRDKDGYFTAAPRRKTEYQFTRRERLNFKFDLSSQITKGHFLKSGFEIGLDKVLTFWERWQSMTSFTIRAAASPYDENEPWEPIQSSWYIQDKMEFEGLVLNVGLRYDRLDWGTQVPQGEHGLWSMAPMTKSWTRQQLVPLRDAKALQAWSPRIGASHPITDRATIRFSYGVFRQLPSTWYIAQYGWVSRARAVDFNNNGQIDPAEVGNQSDERDWSGSWDSIDYETTTSFEVGTDWNFIEDYVGSLTVFYKSGTDQMYYGNSYWWDPQKQAPQRGGADWRNNSYEDIRGIELSLKKEFSRGFAFLASYNQQWVSAARQVGAWRTYFVPDSTWVATGTNYYVRHSRDTNGDGVVDGNDSGGEVPDPLTVDEIKEFGHRANERLRSIQNGTAADYDPLKESEIKPMEDWPGMWAYTQYNVAPRNPSTAQGTFGAERPSFGSVSLVYQSPTDYGHLLGDISVTMVYRLQEGRARRFALPGEAPKDWFGPVHTRTDLAFVKQFNLSNQMVHPTLYVNVRNLFNQRDLQPRPGTDWWKNGLELPRPDSATYQQFGDTGELTRYTGFPREVEVGIRLAF